MGCGVENVIRRALADAQTAGRDHLAQTELAVQAVQRARPDMTASDALAAVIVGKPSAFVVFSKYLSMFLRGSDSSPSGSFGAILPRGWREASYKSSPRSPEKGRIRC